MMKNNLVWICLFIGFCLFRASPIFAKESQAVKKNVITVEFKLVCDKNFGSCKKATVEDSKEEICVQKRPVITLEEITSAETRSIEVPRYFKDALKKIGGKAGSTSIALIIKLNRKGKEKLAEITSQNIGKRMAIFIDGNLVLAPRIHEPILGGELAISYSSFEKAKSIAERINKVNEPSKKN
jgi:preprotein translocase subunit SecD